MQKISSCGILEKCKYRMLKKHLITILTKEKRKKEIYMYKYFYAITVIISR